MRFNLLFLAFFVNAAAPLVAATSCPAGSYCPTSSTSPIPCPPGSYSFPDSTVQSACLPMLSICANSINPPSRQCYAQIWRAAGCLTGGNPWSTSDWFQQQTYASLVSDSLAWAASTDSNHRSGCYGACATQVTATPPSSQCYKQIWKSVGCLNNAGSPWLTADWYQQQTFASLLLDSQLWASQTDTSHRFGCYDACADQLTATPPSLQCYQTMWASTGCLTKSNPWLTADWYQQQTFSSLDADSFLWATQTDPAHLQGCYGSCWDQLASTPPSLACYSQIWQGVGCLTTGNPWLGDSWYQQQTFSSLVTDSLLWASQTDNGHRQGCYGVCWDQLALSPPSSACFTAIWNGVGCLTSVSNISSFLQQATYASLIVDTKLIAYSTDAGNRRQCYGCGAGAFMVGGSLSTSSCSPCPRGQYCPPGTFSPTPCPAGTYNPNTNASWSMQCTQCPLGSYAPAGSARCWTCPDCPAGTYCDHENSCQPCPPNTFSTTTKAAACSACPTNQISLPPPYSSVILSDNGASHVVNIGGIGCSTSSSSSSSLYQCPAGSYIGSSVVFSAGTNTVDVSASCPVCHPGTYSSSINSPSCTSCPANTFSLLGQTSCTPCPALTNSPPGSSACMVCESCLNSQSVEVARGKTLQVSCPNQQLVFVMTAFYGNFLWGRQTCGIEVTTELLPCHGIQSCQLYVRDDLFDPVSCSDPHLLFNYACAPQTVFSAAYLQLVNAESQMAQAYQQSLQLQRDNNPGACWRSSYQRGVGKIPTSCDAGKEYDAGLCYSPCDSGYTGVGFVCWGSCPSGYVDIGAICSYQGLQTVGKGCCCFDIGLWDNGCCGNCPSGWTDTGCLCNINTPAVAKSSYTRGAGTIPTTCDDGYEYEAGLCYPTCDLGYHGILTTCWSNCDGLLNTDCGAKCATSTSACSLDAVQMATTFATGVYSMLGLLAGDGIGIGFVAKRALQLSLLADRNSGSSNPSNVNTLLAAATHVVPDTAVLYNTYQEAYRLTHEHYSTDRQIIVTYFDTAIQMLASIDPSGMGAMVSAFAAGIC